MKSNIFYKLLIIIAIFTFFVASITYAKEQIINLKSNIQNGEQGEVLIVSARYDVSDKDNTLSGIALRIHYNSSSIEFLGVEKCLEKGVISQKPILLTDTKNVDNDSTTDKMLQASWASLDGNWPDVVLDTLLFNMKFKIIKKGGIIKTTVFEKAAGYNVDLKNAVITY